MLAFDYIIRTIDQLLKKLGILLINSMHHILVHEVDEKILGLFTILLFAHFPLLINSLKPVIGTLWSLFWRILFLLVFDESS